VLLSPFEDSIGVLITLQPADEHVKLSLIKDHGNYVTEDLHLMLDAKSLLIAEEK